MNPFPPFPSYRPATVPIGYFGTDNKVPSSRTYPTVSGRRGNRWALHRLFDVELSAGGRLDLEESRRPFWHLAEIPKVSPPSADVAEPRLALTRFSARVNSHIQFFVD